MIVLTKDQAQAAVDWWNCWPVGQRVIFCRCDGTFVDANTTTHAFMLGGVTPVIGIDAVPGYVNIARTLPV